MPRGETELCPEVASSRTRVCSRGPLADAPCRRGSTRRSRFRPEPKAKPKGPSTPEGLPKPEFPGDRTELSGSTFAGVLRNRVRLPELSVNYWAQEPPRK
eukprot:15461186-Alexandrium_andersonii.AAC.1